MPRAVKRPRLWLRPERRNADGSLRSKSVWVILDGGKHVATGCAASETGEADGKLRDYLANKHEPPRREAALSAVSLADVLSIYFDDCGSRQASQKRFNGRMARLAAFWQQKTLADVTGPSCREYAAQRGNKGGGRRDLEDLRAAINHHRKEGYHREMVEVVLPAKGEARQRWLTRAEAARLLWVCWRTRERQTAHRGKRLGEAVETQKHPLRHLARFILIGLYTGTRAGAIATASPIPAEGRSYVDLDRGVFYRLAAGRRVTNKRQPPAPLPPRLLAHLRRWARLDAEARSAGKRGREHFVEFGGAAVSSVKTGFRRAAILALGDASAGVSPHTLRHTAATWTMQNGAPIWEAAGYLGMSEKTLRDVYGHHHPDHQSGAVAAVTARPVSLVVSLAAERKRRAKLAETLVGPAGLEPATRPL